MLCGLQDNGSFYNDGSAWWEVTGGDGMDNAIHPINDYVQITSYQYGNFFLSLDQGATRNALSFTGSGTGAWLSPVVFDPKSPDTIYFGLKNVYASYNAGATVNSLTTGALFPSGAISLAVAPSASNVLYAGDYTRIMKSTDWGHTWVNISAGLPTFAAKTFIAVDFNDPNKVYVTFSGYSAGTKVYMTTNGITWANISTGLPNVPVNCIAVDSSSPGALFAATDMGVFYRDNTVTSWALYNTGLPNVIVDDIDINYTNYKIRVATFGRGVWECKLKKPASTAIQQVTNATHEIQLYPNPAVHSWKLLFSNQTPQDYSVKVTDAAGHIVQSFRNKDFIDASGLAKGIYHIEITSGDIHETLKGVKY